MNIGTQLKASSDVIREIFDRLKITKTFYIIFGLFYISFYYCENFARLVMPFLFNGKKNTKDLDFLSSLDTIHYFIIIVVIFSIAKLIDFFIDLIFKIISIIKKNIINSNKISYLNADIKFLKNILDGKSKFYQENGSSFYFVNKSWKYIIFSNINDDEKKIDIICLDENGESLNIEFKPILLSSFKFFISGRNLFHDYLFINPALHLYEHNSKDNQNFFNELIINEKFFFKDKKDYIIDIVNTKNLQFSTCVFFDYESFKLKFYDCLINYVSKYTDFKRNELK